MLRAGSNPLLWTPVLTGSQAFLCGLVAVACPTLVRAAVNGVIMGCEFTPYLPFVLAAAILLRWWQAGLVAIMAVAIMGGLFQGATIPSHQPCFERAAGLFLAASAMVWTSGYAP